LPDLSDGRLKKLIEQQWANSSAWSDLTQVMRLALSFGGDQSSGTVSTLSRFARLPNLSCQAAGGNPQWADELSAAWLLYYAAADLMDTVQDEDDPEDWWASDGPGTALSAASGLYFSASLLLNNLHRNEHTKMAVVDVIKEFYDQFLVMCSGQYRDITLDQPTLEEYWQIIEAKSGAFFMLACRCGARLATADALALENFGSYGKHLGVIVQITDELDDVRSLDTTGGAGQRPELASSLPVIYALEVLPPAEQNYLRESLNQAPNNPNAAEAALEIIDNCGAAVYLLAEMECHRKLGTEALERAAVDSPPRDALLDILRSV
jgi:geranylgeranyl pyrophosphate synthase